MEPAVSSTDPELTHPEKKAKVGKDEGAGEVVYWTPGLKQEIDPDLTYVGCSSAGGSNTSVWWRRNAVRSPAISIPAKAEDCLSALRQVRGWF